MSVIFKSHLFIRKNRWQGFGIAEDATESNSMALYFGVKCESKTMAFLRGGKETIPDHDYWY